ncbi:MAG: protein kinase [Acidobacteria bacterium]|nr:protein kinase [Acidobacteriota bacterium]
MAIPLMKQIEGKYEILEKMGEGGMGSVYKVRHRVLEEIRVIKVMRQQLAADEKLRVRFLREAKTAIRLRHPNVAQLYDCTVDDDGNAYMVMEFIEGVTFEQILEQIGPPPTGLALEMAAQSLKALASLHRKKVIHRDIAPDNLMLSRSEDDEPLVKLIDLGIAKTLEADIHLTATGMFVGKLRYSSPEHFQRQEGVPIDARSDLYSFGVVLYELLTGRHPISGTSMSALIAGHLFHPPRSFAETDPDGRVPQELREIVLKALCKSADDRYQSASDFRQALAVVQEDFPIAEQDLDRALALQPPPTIRFPVVRRGKTQEELDRQFAPIPTPPPDMVTTATPPPIPGAGTVEEADAGAASVAAEREAAVAEAAAAVAAALTAGDLDRARRELDAAVDRFGKVEPLQEASAKVAAEVAARHSREMRVKALVDEARRQLARGELEAARQHLDSAASIEPSSSVLDTLRGELEAAARAREVELQRERQLASKAQEIGALLKSNSVEEAREELEKAERQYGSEKVLRDLRSRLGKAEEAERKQRVEAMRQKATDLLSAGRLREAVALLEQALGLGLSDQETARQLAAARRKLREEEARQEHEQAVAAAAQAIETHLGQGRLDDAWQAIQSAPDKIAASKELGRLRAKVEADLNARRERQKKVEALLDEARRRISAGQLDQALGHLREAERLDPSNEAARSLRHETEGAVRQREEARRREQLVAEASARVRRHLDQGDLERASSDLAKAEQALGDTSALKALRADLEAATQRALQARLETLTRNARELAAAHRFSEAIASLQEAGALAPTDKAVARLLGEMREAQRRHVEEQRRRQKLAKAMAEVEKLLAAGKAKKADRRLAAAKRQLAPGDEFQALEKKVKAAVATPRAAPVRRGRRLLLPIAAAVVVIAIGLAVVLLRGTGKGPAESRGERAAPVVGTSTLVIDAVPWAKITAITDAQGQAQPLPSDDTTPAVLTLPPGTYTLSLALPDRPQPSTVTVTLSEGQTVHEVARLAKVDVNTFFKQMGW